MNKFLYIHYFENSYISTIHECTVVKYLICRLLLIHLDNIISMNINFNVVFSYNVFSLLIDVNDYK